MVVSDYCSEWLSNLSLMASVEPSTIRDYRSNLNAWYSFLEMDMCDVTRRDVERAIRSMLNIGRSPSTVRKRIVTLRRVFEDAVSYGDVDSNPFDGVKAPKVRKVQHNYLPTDERERLKALIARSNSQICVAAAIALYTGLREGEICGLMRSDIDLEGGFGWVRRSVGRSTEGTYLKGVKNDHMRDFPIPEPLSVVISRWFDTKPIRGGDFLLSGTPKFADPIVLGRKWTSLCEVEGFLGILGKRPTFHDLRHTYATVAIASGVDVKTVSSILGHSSAAMTLDVYAVADPMAKKLSADILSRAI